MSLLRDCMTRSVAPRALALALACFPCAALAQSPEEITMAKQTAREGLTAYQQRNFERALQLFEQAQAIYPSGNIVRMYGYSLLALERWGPALEQLERCLEVTVGPLSEADRAEVQANIQKARTHFHFLSVSSTVDGAVLLIDGGESIPLPLAKPIRLDPGKHALIVRAKGYSDAVADDDFEAGGETTLTLDPKKREAPKPPPPPKKMVEVRTGWFGGQEAAGYGLLGSGVALGVGAGIVGGLSAALRSTVENDIRLHEQYYGVNCAKGDPRLCAFDRAVINLDADREEQLRWTAIGIGIGGGALTALGTVFLLGSEKGPLAKKERREEATAPRCIPTVAGPALPGVGAWLGVTGVTCGGRF
jgi:hypothetical protein